MLFLLWTIFKIHILAKNFTHKFLFKIKFSFGVLVPPQLCNKCDKVAVLRTISCCYFFRSHLYLYMYFHLLFLHCLCCGIFMVYSTLVDLDCDLAVCRVKVNGKAKQNHLSAVSLSLPRSTTATRVLGWALTHTAGCPRSGSWGCCAVSWPLSSSTSRRISECSERKKRSPAQFKTNIRMSFTLFCLFIDLSMH